MSGKNLVLKLNAKMLSVNQTTGFLNFNISKTIGGIKQIFFCAGAYLLKLQIDGVIFGGHCQACQGMLKESVKTLRSQKLRKL